VTSKIDEDKEGTKHAKRENDVLNKDSIDADLKESNKDGLDKIEETVDVLGGELNLVLGNHGFRSFLLLEVSNNTHDISAKSSKGGEESNPADEAKDGEVVAKKKNKEDIDSAEDSKGLDEIIPKEDFLHLTEERTLLEGLADHLARALTRAGRSGLLLFLGSFLLLGGFLLLRGFLNGCGLFYGLFFFNGCGCRFTFFRHV